MPTIDAGVGGFCAVVLIEGERRILFDSAHGGRRVFLQEQPAERGRSARGRPPLPARRATASG